jgi:four helix bundle protein
MGPQVLRAADSVGANIAEAVGRWHTPDKRRLLIIARGSLNELEHWLTTAERRGLLEHGTANRVDRIAQALNGMIRRPGWQRPTANGERRTANESYARSTREPGTMSSLPFSQRTQALWPPS